MIFNPTLIQKPLIVRSLVNPMDDASMMLEHLGFQEINLTNAITLDFKRKRKISLQKKKQTNNI
jgi:hypothetical protein